MDRGGEELLMRMEVSMVTVGMCCCRAWRKCNSLVGLGRCRWKSCSGLQNGREWSVGRKSLAVLGLMRRVSDVGAGWVCGILVEHEQRRELRQLALQVCGGSALDRSSNRL